MNFIQVDFSFEAFEEFMADILAAELAEIGFDSFVPCENGMQAFIPETKFDENNLKDAINNYPLEVAISYEIVTVAPKNWNEEWEKHYFEPIVIGEECVIHSSFHKDIPVAKYDIIIDPKMSFGTGHHETTSLVIGEILKMNLTNKKVLDMGCGTAVLAILAAMRGASELLAIDIDSWCTENSLENIALNKVSGIEVKHGVYVGVQGPTFETPAEYPMYRILGGDAVGMSTVPEVIVARHCGIKVFGISIITDLGGFDVPVQVSHEEVQIAANNAQPKMTEIMREMIRRS